jgi:formylglycine-generating enzyme required for sulfatase activity
MTTKCHPERSEGSFYSISEKLVLVLRNTGGKEMRSKNAKLFLGCMVMLVLVTLLSGCAERNDWKKAQQTNTIESYQAFLKQYPNGKFTEKAKTTLEKAEWDKATQSKMVGDLLVYLKKYPKSSFVAQAKAEVDKLIMPKGKDNALMVMIPEGEFEMGYNDGDEDEKPIHKVFLKPFYIDIYEVTNAQYQKFVDETNYKKPSHWKDPMMNAPNQPVVSVNWFDANEYCKWAGKRLPTEAEWEKAARGGLVGKPYPLGDKISQNDANFYGIADKDYWEKTAIVGSITPNGFGLYDVAGNAQEWCADIYDGNYYANSPQQNPTGPKSGKDYVLRGGSWGDEYISNKNFGLRVARRRHTDPFEANQYTGLRCVMDVGQ